MEQKPKSKNFDHRFWAVLLLLGGIQQLLLPYFMRDVITFPPISLAFGTISGIIAICAAVGLWLKRRWGLWLYMAGVVFSFISGIYHMIAEQNATGEVSLLGQRILTLVLGGIFLIFLYSQREHFD